MLSRSGQGDATMILSVGAVAKGILLSFGVTLLVAAFLGLAVSLTQWEGIAGGAYWFSYASIALGGMLAAKQSKKLGWLHGAVVGLAYFLIAVTLLQPEFQWGMLAAGTSLLKALGCLASGAVGGMLGVNV